jgi:hypothetical protein
VLCAGSDGTGFSETRFDRRRRVQGAGCRPARPDSYLHSYTNQTQSIPQSTDHDSWGQKAV